MRICFHGRISIAMRGGRAHSVKRLTFQPNQSKARVGRSTMLVRPHQWFLVGVVLMVIYVAFAENHQDAGIGGGKHPKSLRGTPFKRVDIKVSRSWVQGRPKEIFFWAGGPNFYIGGTFQIPICYFWNGRYLPPMRINTQKPAYKTISLLWLNNWKL